MYNILLLPIHTWDLFVLSKVSFLTPLKHLEEGKERERRGKGEGREGKNFK